LFWVQPAVFVTIPAQRAPARRPAVQSGLGTYGFCVFFCVSKSSFYEGKQVNSRPSGPAAQYTPKIAPINSPALTGIMVIFTQNIATRKIVQALSCFFFWHPIPGKNSTVIPCFSEGD
jgi:hypothetical protein